MAKPSKTALFNAAKKWDCGTVAALLGDVPDLISATDPKHRTALHLACSVRPSETGGLLEPNGLKTVETLLDAGAPLEGAVPTEADAGDFQATPLWYAVARGENRPLVEFLLRRGANPSHSLWAAVWRDDDAMCRALLEFTPTLNLRAHGETPIFYAARLQRLATLRLLIDAGADPSIVDDRGRDCVDIARERRLPSDIVAMLEALRERIKDQANAQALARRTA
ncbi:ankyrin [Pandoraea captiosa]|uniref:Ankyrin n=1 Tax=Pandoraea captiosa TaxID=2508302 RepID=A0A5E5AGA8_9BURK|nr:ankyrin repeat domain-containing protein [Pandoraea captiosa]VVE71902.1 ankyrin [Pandoraea captiosa]